ncbi:MAG: DUF4405 domain-containing protein [Spirochaetia bacterium]|nr:DUF4405 domain-containing protein [Spirochaetia bacterium]
MATKNALKVVNVLLAIVFLSLAVSGIVQGLFGYPIPYEIFRVAHPVSGYLLALLVAAHLWLNRAWVKNTYFGKKR